MSQLKDQNFCKSLSIKLFGQRNNMQSKFPIKGKKCNHTGQKPCCCQQFIKIIMDYPWDCKDKVYRRKKGDTSNCENVW